MLPRPLPLNMYKASAEYIRVRELGEGGDGTVTLWTHKSNGQLIAVKTCGKDTDNAELLSEVDKLVHLIDCPQIIRLLGSSKGCDNGVRANIFLEFCQYGDADDYRALLVDEYGYLPEATLWKLFIDMSKALNFIHDTKHPLRRPMLHLDLKPANILVSRPKYYHGEGLPLVPDFKLADFTRSKFWNPNKPPEKVNGTPEYMPPESYLGAAPSIDIWSLGASIQALALNIMPTVTLEPFKQSYITLNGPQRRAHDYEFWRMKLPGKYRPINLSKEDQIKFLKFKPHKTCPTYSHELNRWYRRCMASQRNLRITAEKLVRDMVPIGEKEIERLEREVPRKPKKKKTSKACQPRWTNKTPYPGNTDNAHKGKVAEAVAKLENAAQTEYIAYAPKHTDSSVDYSDDSGSYNMPEIPEELRAALAANMEEMEARVRKEASEEVMARRRILQPRGVRDPVGNVGVWEWERRV